MGNLSKLKKEIKQHSDKSHGNKAKRKSEKSMMQFMKYGGKEVHAKRK